MAKVDTDFDILSKSREAYYWIHPEWRKGTFGTENKYLRLFGFKAVAER